MTKRLRDKSICLKVTDKEYELIKLSMEEANYSVMREYLTDLLINGYVINKDTKGINELAYEINRVGNNINQAVHIANYNGSISKDMIAQIEENQKEIYFMLKNLIKMLI